MHLYYINLKNGESTSSKRRREDEVRREYKLQATEEVGAQRVGKIRDREAKEKKGKKKERKKKRETCNRYSNEEAVYSPCWLEFPELRAPWKRDKSIQCAHNPRRKLRPTSLHFLLSSAFFHFALEIPCTSIYILFSETTDPLQNLLRKNDRYLDNAIIDQQLRQNTLLCMNIRPPHEEFRM